MDLPNAIICDIDRTLALFGEEDNPYHRDFLKDTVNRSVLAILYRFQADTTIFLVTGRKESDRAVTKQWLANNAIPYDYLYMRQNSDIRTDYTIKLEIYNKYVKHRCTVIAVFDDRLSVCRLWYELGLPLFRVGDPGADF